MSEVSVTKMTKKKILGVPLLYLLAGFVLVIALYAWKTKGATPEAVATDTAASTDASAPIGGETYPNMPQGTVIVSPVTTPTAGVGGNASIVTNDDWIKAGVPYLATMGISAGTAQVALQAYLSGSQLSFIQGGYRDLVIGKFGMPPFLQDIGGTDPVIPPTVPKPAPVNDTAIQLAIKRAYRISLGREASDNEVAGWVKSGTKESDLARKIANSHEARNASITNYYRVYLKRAPAATELAYWSNAHLSLATVEARIAGSGEAKKKK